VSAPRYDVQQLAADARRTRANAAAFRAWDKAGAPLDGVGGRPGEQHPTYKALPGVDKYGHISGSRSYWLRQARKAEELLLMYARAIERGWTATDSRLVAAFEGDPSGHWTHEAEQARRRAAAGQIELEACP
jgi:hypothetical protein